jgi:hypothetical protein
MIPLPAAIIAVVAAFAPGFSPPVWNPVQVLGVGVVLCPGARPVAAGRRIMGLGQARRLARYHRVLRRARGSGLQAAKILLGLLIRLLPAHGVPMVGVDETGGSVLKVLLGYNKRLI